LTERKQVEKEKAKLEAQNRQLQKAESLGRMAGAIAHHFNNMLAVSIGNLELAIMDLPPGSDVLKNLTQAMKASHKAAEVSSLMLTYLGQTPGKHEPLDLSDICHLGMSMLRAVIPNKVIVETELPSPGPTIRANANQMHQVLTNLITNVWESIGDNGGTIRLIIKTVSSADIPASHCFPIDYQPQSIPYACMEVTDTGCGISDKDIEKIFDPFFTTKFTGRGMGLPVVLGIVRAHNGAVSVESKPGRGSVFRIFLPVSTEEIPLQQEKIVPVQKSAISLKGGGTVLLIEDEEQVREMAGIMLSRLGYTVLEAKDGVEAMEIFQQHQDEIRCVLSDLTMPRMDGWETLVALRKLSPDIPVILSSGYDEARVMADEHTERPNAFIGKPYQLKGLSDTIRRVLSA
jgi:nitrogen-specific signal transduction histidine kinase